MKDIIREFLVESHENLGQLDIDLVTLEREPGERETLARVFRTFHTVKGTAGFLGLTRLQGVSHAAENLLSRLRAGELTFNPDTATALLGVVDAIRAILAALEATETEGDGDYAALVQTLERLAKGPQSVNGRSGGEPAPAAARSIVGRSESMVAVPESRAPAVADSRVRVDVGLLDKLMTLVGELVLARNQMMQFSSAPADAPFVRAVQRLNLLTTELQAGVMKARMQPIETAWANFPRVVRDLATACGKQVRLDMTGQETELDRTVIEAVRDPLAHIVRNAVDHGIEPPADRLARGKAAEGCLRLRAAHAGGKVVVEVADDGGGIDPARVRDKALRVGLVAPELAATMSDRELVNLVFRPGFSTTDRVTHFSGRGVGMDVVRTNVEKVGGTVDLESHAGQGTTVRMTIPLTLAIIPALVVATGGDRYAIPQVSLLELVRLDGDPSRAKVELLYGTPVYRLRGNLLPVVYLDRELAVESVGRGDAYVVVLQAEDRAFGLVVDDIHDAEEIVVKPLQPQLKGIAAFAGATIMGDGTVALILDVPGLAQRAGVASGAQARTAAETAPAAPDAHRETVLLFAANDGRMAVPLVEVTRLEEVPRSAVERAAGRDVVQYCGEILPLVHVSTTLGRTRGEPERNGRPAGDAETLQVVVHSGTGRRVGLVVDAILDIGDVTVTARTPSDRPGVLFTAVVQERVTEFLDVAAVLRAAGAVPAAEPDAAWG